MNQIDRYALVRRARDYLFRPEPATKTVGYWCALGGVTGTSIMILVALWNPSIMRSKSWGIPPSLILAGLGMELIESKTRRNRND